MNVFLVTIIVGIILYLLFVYESQEGFRYLPWTSIDPSQDDDDNCLMNETRIPQPIFAADVFCGRDRNALYTAFPYRGQFDASNRVTDRLIVHEEPGLPYNLDLYSIDFSINPLHSIKNYPIVQEN